MPKEFKIRLEGEGEAGARDRKARPMKNIQKESEGNEKGSHSPTFDYELFGNAAATDDGNGDSLFYYFDGYAANPYEYEVMGFVCFTFTLVLFLVACLPRYLCSLGNGLRG
jgi:hypothetical protein